MDVLELRRAALTAAPELMVAAPPTVETNAAGGRRVLKAGRIAFNAGQPVIDCTVRRLSEDGASMSVISTAGVLDRFKLAIDADGFSRLCQMTRKAEQTIDVAFVWRAAPGSAGIARGEIFQIRPRIERPSRLRHQQLVARESPSMPPHRSAQRVGKFGVIA